MGTCFTHAGTLTRPSFAQHGRCSMMPLDAAGCRQPSGTRQNCWPSPLEKMLQLLWRLSGRPCPCPFPERHFFSVGCSQSGGFCGLTGHSAPVALFLSHHHPWAQEDAKSPSKRGHGTFQKHSRGFLALHPLLELGLLGAWIAQAPQFSSLELFITLYLSKLYPSLPSPSI